MPADDHKAKQWYGGGPLYVNNMTPGHLRASWGTTENFHRAEQFSNLSRAKQVAKTQGLSDQRERLTLEIVQVQEYRDMHPVFPEPNLVEKLAQIESEA